MSPENSRLSLNQSDANPNPITTSSPAFSRALDSGLFFTLSAHWLFRVFYFFLIGHCDYYVNWKAFSNVNKRGNTHSSLLRMVQSYLTILCRLNNLPRFIIKRKPNKDKKIVHVETGTKLYKHLVGEVALVFLYFVLLLV